MKIVPSLLLCVLAACPALHAELTIISAEHHDTQSFKRFSEYFTGAESPGRYALFRSQPERRHGFFVSLQAEKGFDLASVATIRMHYIRPGTQEIDQHTFPAGNIEKRRLLVGLTAAEWDDPDSRPVAWKIELLDASDRALAEARSFLWAEPSLAQPAR